MDTMLAPLPRELSSSQGLVVAGQCRSLGFLIAQARADPLDLPCEGAGSNEVRGAGADWPYKDRDEIGFAPRTQQNGFLKQENARYVCFYFSKGDEISFSFCVNK